MKNENDFYCLLVFSKLLSRSANRFGNENNS